jgi:hypothetical protein
MPAEANELDNIFINVWRQALAEDSRNVNISSQTYPVRKTSGKRLRQVDFEVDGLEYRGLEQNRNSKSRWAELARKGAKVMQFLQSGKYIAAVADGKVTHYSSRAAKK